MSLRPIDAPNRRTRRFIQGFRASLAQSEALPPRAAVLSVHCRSDEGDLLTVGPASCSRLPVYAGTRSSFSTRVHSIGIDGSSESRTEQYLLSARSIAI